MLPEPRGIEFGAADHRQSALVYACLALERKGCSVDHPRRLQREILDLRRRYFMSAEIHHIVGTAFEDQKPVRTSLSNVAREEPPVPEALVRELRIVEITARKAVGADAEAPGLPCW